MDVLVIQSERFLPFSFSPSSRSDIICPSALSALISASLTEDPYGRVQRDIPRTLEALLGYLAALEVLVEGFHGAALGPEEKDETSKVLKGEAEVALDGQSTTWRRSYAVVAT